MIPPATRAGAGPLERLAARLGPWWYSLLAGLLVALAAALAAAPALAPTGQAGAYTAQLAADPFGSAPNPLAPRFLTPLVSWLIGLRGERVLVLIALCCALLPAVAARWALAAGFGGGGALLAAGALGLTLVTRTSLHYGGYADVVTYLLLLLAWTRRERPAQASGLFLLALMSHERALFLLPWLWWSLWREVGRADAGAAARRRRLEALLGPLAAIAIWLPLRALAMSHREVEQTAGYYLQPLRADPLSYVKMAWPWQALGFLSAFQWLWLVPVTRARHVWRAQGRAGLIAMALPIVCAGAQMFFAYDSSRLAALAFPFLLPALQSGLGEGGPFFRRWLALVLLLQVITPQVFTAAHIVEVMPWWWTQW